MYRRIVLPLDGSRFAEFALPLGTRLAQRAGSGMHLVMVAEPDGPTAAQCEAYLEEVSSRVAEDYTGDITRAVRVGNVVERLVEEVSTVEADATVMATHGRGGLSRMWLGSVATAFLHQSERPLLLVRPRPVDDEPVVHWGFAKLLVPLDGSDLSEEVLAHATEFGQMFAAAYHLTRIVVPPVDIATALAPPSVDATTALLETTKEQAGEYLDERAVPLRERGLTVTTSVHVDPQAGHGILTVADQEGCDSIAMATRGRVGLSRALLGSAADKVLRGAAVPILLYRVDAPSG